MDRKNRLARPVSVRSAAVQGLSLAVSGHSGFRLFGFFLGQILLGFFFSLL